MSTRSGRIRTSIVDSSPPRTRPSRSPARARKISPARKSPPSRQTARKSPSRKSPVRKTLSPSRKTLSPSRKTPSKFPARKSPARTKKDAPLSAPATPKSPTKRPVIKSNVSVRLENLSAKIEEVRTRSKRTEYSVQDIKSTQSEFALDKLNGIEPISEVYGLRTRKFEEDVPPRRSSRLRDFIETVPELDSRRSSSISQSQSKSISKSMSKSIDAYSDEDNSEEELLREKSKSVNRKLSTPLRNSINTISQIASRYEFGGRIGTAALIFLIPLTVVSVLTSCTKSCSFEKLISFSPFKSVLFWFSVPTAIATVAQVFLQAIFAILPILGPWAYRMDNTERKYCFNAAFASIMTIFLLYGLDFYQIIDNKALLGDYLRLATGSYIFAVLLSTALYVKSHKSYKNDLNPYGNSGKFLYDFFMGREIHPNLKKLNVKIWISRICNINTLFLSTLIFTQGVKLQLKENEELDLANYTELWNRVSLQPTILTFSMFQIIYILNFIISEYKVTSTFYWQSEGVGYLQTVASSLYPFYFTTLSKYVADTNLMLSTNTLILASGLFTLGFLIMVASNSIKYEFRRNPLQPSLANLISMPTFQGNKLLVSGLWGAVRHPNYLGDILIHSVLSVPGILTGEVIAAAPALITILVLLHRAWRDNSRCSRRYGAAWQRYCKKVPFVIIPKVL